MWSWCSKTLLMTKPCTYSRCYQSFWPCCHLFTVTIIWSHYSFDMDVLVFKDAAATVTCCRNLYAVFPSFHHSLSPLLSVLCGEMKAAAVLLLSMSSLFPTFIIFLSACCLLSLCKEVCCSSLLAQSRLFISHWFFSSFPSVRSGF